MAAADRDGGAVVSDAPSLSPFAIRVLIAGALIIVPVVMAIEFPIRLGQRDETGLMVSWIATPIAANLLASAFGSSRKRHLLIAFIASAVIAVTIGVVTRVMWQLAAGEWMLQKAGIVNMIVFISVIGEVIAATILALLLTARPTRADESAS